MFARHFGEGEGENTENECGIVFFKFSTVSPIR